MILKNGLVFTEDARFVLADVESADGKIAQVAAPGTLDGPDAVDVSGKYVTPGFVDIHIHGSKGSDFCDAGAEHIETMSAYLGGEGVTAFCGTTMAFDEPILTNIFNIAKPYINKETGGAVLRGINMEGPFFNKAKKGAQAEKYIVDPEIEMFDRLYELSSGAIKLIDVAPELPGAAPFIERASKKCVVSIAHTTANYDQAKAAFAAGASHVTHLFNAMPPFNHRDPGVVGAASDDAAHVEMISDGIHLHPAVVRSVPLVRRRARVPHQRFHARRGHAQRRVFAGRPDRVYDGRQGYAGGRHHRGQRHLPGRMLPPCRQLRRAPGRGAARGYHQPGAGCGPV